MEKGRTIDALGVLVVFFILLFVYTRLAGPIPFSINSINTNKTDLFEASGTGKSAAAPDRARVSVGVTESSSNVVDAQGKVNTKANSIINAIKGLGVDEKDIKTTNYSVNPNYSFDGGQKITGYSVTQNIEIKADISKINQVVDRATSNGANMAGGVEFILSDENLTKLENEARKEAVENAKKKAEGLAKAAGLRLGKIVDVRQVGGEGPRAVFMEAAKTDQAEPSQPTNITPGENNVEVTITLIYQTL
ncbi:MAG: SIMPL domain-containing protein [Candidatus Levybacteria bacterium]|nr:SIMPL domain-containing protein [Candidatus Levybacteria bacterium]